ncbi:hypothetical protein [Nocardia sp. R6R-6]|uniref:hypothetical protein n=1 Tax=Nocardia sp. R6R-6 TaxID=3459303 RepID=UPI00403DE5CE
MATISGSIILVASHLDCSIMPDPMVRYQPEPIAGRRYQLIPVTPRPAPEPTG